MSHYLLSTYAVKGAVPRAPNSPKEMEEFMKRVAVLEDEMEAKGSFVFGGALHGPNASTVVDFPSGEAIITDGPFAETKEHIAGFYIINAEDLDEALGWAGKVAEATRHPIEVRPFSASGRIKV